eukprot:m.215364 g.215364  ORF g.215364 m.215364 type:complete len:783 (+) comp19095_c0_seq1:55-2403(+)
MANADMISLFQSVGLSESKAQETAVNSELASAFKTLIEKAGGPPLEKSQGVLVYNVVTKLGAARWLDSHVDMLMEHIKHKRLTSSKQLDAAFDYLKNGGAPGDGFASATGIGITVTTEQITQTVLAVLNSHMDELKAQRYRFNTGVLLGSVRETLKWADGKIAKTILDEEIVKVLGPKTEADLAKPVKKKKTPKAPKTAESTTTKQDAKVVEKEEIISVALQGKALQFHKPGGNDTTDGYVVTPTTKARLAAHLKRTGGQVRTRFPPEPNGILHIGHAKAINFNFSYAKVNNGICFLRYDDTNPEKEEERFFVGILDAITWLGFKPYKITHSSDYFDELFALAVKLIETGQAYVCHQQADEMKGHETKVHSPWRDRPIAESLQLFQDMKNGKIDEGKATLRMKHIMKDGKLDPVAYRIKFCAHHRSGDKWCIYPTYDYTHCLCDSFEDITHSLCTKEFENRRPSYYWLCNAVDVYTPVQWEYSRLNVLYAVVSKRKIAKLIGTGCVRDWDDPRLMTLTALRRRGFPPKAILDFVNKVGITESTDTSLDPAAVEACVRDELNVTAPRAMAVTEPLRVDIDNLPADFPTTVSVPNINFDESAGKHTVPVCSVLYINRDDFEEEGSKGFKRLTPIQSVGLKYLNMSLSVNSVVKEGGKVVGLKCSVARNTPDNKPKGYIQWVSSPSPDKMPTRAELRVYSRLFHHPNPEDPEVVPGGFLSDVNPDSLKVFDDALIDESTRGAAVGSVFQFERIGYFCVDPDSTPTNPVYNLTLALKGEAGKSSNK